MIQLQLNQFNLRHEQLIASEIISPIAMVILKIKFMTLTLIPIIKSNVHH